MPGERSPSAHHEQAVHSVRSSRGSVATVGAGLAVLGVSASVYLVLAARALGPTAFSGVAVLWTLVYTVGIGLFLPFEQEVARAVALRRASGQGTRRVVVRAALAASLVLALLSIGVLATLPLTFSVFFGDSAIAVLGLLLACAGLGMQYLQRGALSGSGDFRTYSTQLAVEGLFRLLATGLLFLGGVQSPTPYVLLLGLAPIASVLAVWPRFARLVRDPGPPAVWRDLSTNLLWLIAAAIAAQALANLGTVAVRLLGHEDPTATGHFMAGLTVSRIPLFAFAAVQAILIPRLTHRLARGHQSSFRAQLRAFLVVTATLGAAGILGAGLFGPQVLGLLFGSDFVLARADLVWLAVSTAIYMLALTLQAAVIALGDHRTNAIAWWVGTAAFLGALAVPGDPFRRVELALTIGGVTTAVVLGARASLIKGRAGRQDLSADPATSRIGME